MARVAVPGVGTFTVDDAIKSLPPDQQAAEVESMVSQYRAHTASQPPAQASDALDLDVPLPTDGDSAKLGSKVYGVLPGSLQRGVNYAGAGVASTLSNILGTTRVGGNLRASLDQDALFQPSTTADMAQSLRGGQLLRAASDIPGALLEGAPQVLPALGMAALAPEAIPAGVAAAAGGALGGIATQSGDLAAARAAHNGNATPSFGDRAVGVLAGAGLGALSGVGLEAGGTLPARLLANAAADAGQNAGQQLATTAGTRDGAQVDPASLASSAILGAAGRAGLAGVGTAASLASPAAREAALAGRWADMSPAEQARASAQSGAATALQQAMQDAPGATPAQAARTAAANLAGGVAGLSDRLVAQGALDRNGAGVIGSALQAARSPGMALTGDHIRAVEGLGLDDPTTAALSTGLLHLDALTSPDALATSGPLQAIGGATGHALGHVVGLGPVGGAITSRIGGAVGGGLGSVGDAVLGLGQPALLRDGSRASAMLDAAGEAAPAPAGDQLAAATATARNVLDQQRQLIAQQQATDAANAQRFGLDYGDAQVMNRQVDQAANFQRAQQVGDATAMDRQMTQDQNFQRGQEVGDASAMDRQMTAGQNFQRAQDVANATAMDQQMNGQRTADIQDATVLDRQRTAALNFQRGQQVGDAQAIDAAQTRGTNLLESQGGQVAMMALRRAQAQEALSPATTPQDPAGGPVAPPGTSPAQPVSSPSSASLESPDGLSGAAGAATNRAQALAAMRALAPTPGEAQGTPNALMQALGQPGTYAPDLGGLPPAALAQAARLPDWQWGIGKSLQDALMSSGQARPVNMAEEVNNALGAMRDRGWLPPDVADGLKKHQGRIMPALYDLLRQEVLLRNGINRTVSGAGQPAVPTAQPLPTSQPLSTK